MNIKTTNNYFLKTHVTSDRSDDLNSSKVEFKALLQRKLGGVYPGLTKNSIDVISDVMTNKVFLGTDYSGKIKKIIDQVLEDL